MLEPKDTMLYHISSFEAAIDQTDRFLWNISISEGNGKWAVWTGDQRLLVTDNREVVDAFILGMGLAYSVISEDATKGVIAEVGLGEEYEEIMSQQRQQRKEQREVGGK